MDLKSSTFITEGRKFKTYKQLFLCFHFIYECWNVYISYYRWVQCYEFRLNLEYEKKYIYEQNAADKLQFLIFPDAPNNYTDVQMLKKYTTNYIQ